MHIQATNPQCTPHAHVSREMIHAVSMLSPCPCPPPMPPSLPTWFPAARSLFALLLTHSGPPLRSSALPTSISCFSPPRHSQTSPLPRSWHCSLAPPIRLRLAAPRLLPSCLLTIPKPSLFRPSCNKPSHPTFAPSSATNHSKGNISRASSCCRPDPPTPASP